jgi:hypothetical protein
MKATALNLYDITVLASVNSTTTYRVAATDYAAAEEIFRAFDTKESDVITNIKHAGTVILEDTVTIPPVTPTEPEAPVTGG